MPILLQYENKFSAADAELQILKVQFTELKAAHDSDAKELAELRSAHSKDSVALKASRDGTKGLLEQRDLAKREAAEMGAKAAQLRSQLEASEAAQQDVRDEAASFKTERDSALEGRRQALLTVDKQKMDHQVRPLGNAASTVSGWCNVVFPSSSARVVVSVMTRVCPATSSASTSC